MKISLPLWLISLLSSFTIQAQHQQCNHTSDNHICSLEAVYENRFTYVAPPAGFVPGAERSVIINVDYNGFTAPAQVAFQYAVDIWASLLTSSVPIQVEANWENIPGNTLGYAGAQYYYPNVPGSGNSYYHPASLANKIAGSDLLPGQIDITASFDSGTAWYFGTDGNCPANQFDFVSVVLHELGHGIGMVGSASVNAGLGSFAFHPNFDIYDTFVENNPGTDIISYSNNSAALATQLQGNNLYWNGALALANNGGTRPKLYAPNPFSQGSSYAHLDETLYPAGNANSLMTPQIGFAEAIHDPGAIVTGMMEDIGWSIDQGGGGGGDCLTYNFYLETDCWGEETSWYILDNLGNVVYGVNAATLADLTPYLYDVCLEPGCYTLIIQDTFGDGLSGGQYQDCLIDGYFELFDNLGGTVTFMGTANFGFEATFDFCVDGVEPVTICDCNGTEHTDGVLTWLGDGFADNGAFEWEGQPVDFNCATWGYDCGDIAGAPNQDPYGVCSGNLPPQNGCGAVVCSPLGLDISQEPCQDNGNGILPVIGLTFTTGGCIVEEICLFVNGLETCYFMPDFGLYPGDGETVYFVDTEPGADYVIEFTTDNGDVAGPFLWENGICGEEELICDCAGTEHTIGVLSWLGDTFADDGSFEWNGQPVDFNCATWGYDCGDIVGAPNQDPYGVCEGNLPPNNGCAVSVCDPMALTFEALPCVDNGNGLLPSFDINFTIGGGCIAQELCFVVNGQETCFYLPDFELFPGDGGTVTLIDTEPNAVYSFYFTTDAGEVSDTFTYTNGNCEDEATVCDCDGVEHTIGVVTWIGDGFGDDGTYYWNGQTVNFNCSTWGFDCGDIANAPDLDPNGVCEGNLPPNNGCDDSDCGPLSMTLEQLPCLDQGDGLLPAINVAFSIGGECLVDQLCFVFDGLETCFDMVELGLLLGDGDQINIVNTTPDGIYTFYYTTDDGTVSPTFYWENGNCDNEVIICDCAGTQLSSGVLSWLGDTFADDGSFLWNGSPVDFNCETWGYDCGDIVGAPNSDPYGVCEGNLPPNNGCAGEVLGCTDPTALNYNPLATINDGSCLYELIEGCTDPEACNYNEDAQVDDESCYYGCYGCTDEEACNYNQASTIDDGSCSYTCYGCTDPEAVNFDPLATIDDGSCSFEEIEGCTDEEALNYNPDATIEDGSCIYDCEYPLITFTTFCEPGNNNQFFVEMDILDLGNAAPYVVSNNVNDDELLINFTGTIELGPFNNNTNVLFTVDSEDLDDCLITSQLLSDDCSSQVVEGCTDLLATNYDALATVDDGSCTYDFEICDCDLETWSPAERFRLGDGIADEGAPGPNFNCETWAYDCGDIAGAPTEDPYFVCEGFLPPLDGCIDNINENSTSEWMVYPNPASGMFFIEHQNVIGKIALTVTDATGRVIYLGEFVGNGEGRMELDLLDAAAGTYFLSIVNGDTRTAFPIVIQK